MDRSTSNGSRDRTTSVQYNVFCGKLTPDGEMYQFKYYEQAPISLCIPHGNGNPIPDPDKTGHFMTSVIERHHSDILCRRSWRCVSCNKPAEELLHSALPFLSPGPDALPEFRPTILDIASPICRSGGACDRLAEELVHKLAQSALGEDKFKASKTCDWCGGKSDIKTCAGCRTLG
jgi:hypothetical protein